MPNRDEWEDLVDTFYDAVADPERWDIALEKARKQFSAIGAVLGFVDPTAPQSLLGIGAGAWSRDAMGIYIRDYSSLDILPGRYGASVAGKAISSMELVTSEEMRRDIFYNEFYRPRGFAETLGGRLTSGSSAFGVVGLHRAAEQEEFDQTERARLEALMPHLARTLRLRRSFARLSIDARSLAATVDRLTAGVAISDAQGRPIHVNDALRRFVARGDGLRLDRSGRLGAVGAQANRALSQFQASVLKGDPGGLVQIPRQDSAKPYVALVTPLPAGMGFAGEIGQGRFGVLVLVHDPNIAKRSPTEALASMFGLTKRAAELTAALAAGHELKDYATDAGLSFNTARFHLKVAFSRLGVSSQAQLVRLAVRALADLNL